MAEFQRLRTEIGEGLGDEPVRLDYRQDAVEATMARVRRRLASAADTVAQDWWVPASYERLAEVVRRLGLEQKDQRALPMLSREALQKTLLSEPDESLKLMGGDPQLLQRGVEYLEAVGDVLIDERVDCLLLDPVGWFASFLAHFIRDDGNRPAEVVRGVVRLPDIVAALRHEYDQPEAQLPEVMALVCKLELCIRQSDAAHKSHNEDDEAFLFPCLLPAATPHELSQHWPGLGDDAAAAATAASAATLPVIRGHRFRATSGFVPPGLFPTLVARLARLPEGCVHSSRLWNNAAILRFPASRVLLRLDLDSATLDILVAASSDEKHFVGAAKGQASVLKWMSHLVSSFVRRSYERVPFTEARLCPSPECHSLGGGGSGSGGADPGSPLRYKGTEFVVESPMSSAVVARVCAEHVCEREGCWHQLGTGHKLVPTRLRDGEEQVCVGCKQTPSFALRAGGQFGWASKADAELLRSGLSIAQPSLGLGRAAAGVRY